MHISSDSFSDGDPIPDKYTKDGENISPPLSWSEVPQGTKELLLICDDPDAPTPEPFVHWVVYGLAPDRKGIPEGGARDGAPDFHVGLNSRNETAYIGPAPPEGDDPHHYHFRLYALDEKTNLPDRATRTDLQEAMAGRVLAQSELEGTYART